MQSTLRALQLVGSVIECDADGCHGDAKGELLLLIRNLRSGEAKFQLDDYERIAEHAQAALDAHDTRKRMWAMAKLHIELWKRVTDFLDS
ncbi:MAG: hypothetical protein ABI538_10880 [Pseudoxanthomonas sp.]